MENTETMAPETEAAVIENPAQEAEVTADELLDQLNSEPVPEQPAEEPEQTEEQEEELSPEEARTAQITSGLQALIDAGWSKEELGAFVADAAVKQDIAGGKSVEQATIAYLHRAMRAQSATKPAAKKGVPTFRNAATAGAKEQNRIETMSDEEFARFSDRMYEEAMGGKRIRL